MTSVSDVQSTSASSAATTTASTSSTSSNDAASADRFLTLLVAQMENQDPLNPMDNAQVTSQMAQISTVSGIEKLNATMQGLNTRYLQMQTLQGASMVGRNVLMAGNHLSVADDGKIQGIYELASPADSVKVEILAASGAVIDTIELSAQTSGRHEFDWAAKPGGTGGETFRITAKTGAASVTTTTLMRDRVDAVATGGDTLTLELRHFGSVPFEQIKTLN